MQSFVPGFSARRHWLNSLAKDSRAVMTIPECSAQGEDKMCIIEAGASV
jgi:hypothetical protein